MDGWWEEVRWVSGGLRLARAAIRFCFGTGGRSDSKVGNDIFKLRQGLMDKG